MGSNMPVCQPELKGPSTLKFSVMISDTLTNSKRNGGLGIGQHDGGSSSGDEITADHPTSVSSSGGSSKSASPTSDLGRMGDCKYRFDHKESHAITDVLICHTDVHEFRYNVIT